MPIYEYVCRECGAELEQLQRLSDDALTDCPACGESALKRKISAAGFRLSGGGWYETDFKSDGKRNLAGGDDKSSPPAAASNGDGKAGEGKSSESKPSEGSSTTATTAPASKASAKPSPASSEKSGPKKSEKHSSSNSSSSAS